MATISNSVYKTIPNTECRYNTLHSTKPQSHKQTSNLSIYQYNKYNDIFYNLLHTKQWQLNKIWWLKGKEVLKDYYIFKVKINTEYIINSLYIEWSCFAKKLYSWQDINWGSFIQIKHKDTHIYYIFIY